MRDFDRWRYLYIHNEWRHRIANKRHWTDIHKTWVTFFIGNFTRFRTFCLYFHFSLSRTIITNNSTLQLQGYFRPIIKKISFGAPRCILVGLHMPRRAKPHSIFKPTRLFIFSPKKKTISNFDFQISNFKNLKIKNSNNWKKEKITYDLLGNVTCPIVTHHVSKRLWAAENDKGSLRSRLFIHVVVLPSPSGEPSTFGISKYVFWPALSLSLRFCFSVFFCFHWRFLFRGKLQNHPYCSWAESLNHWRFKKRVWNTWQWGEKFIYYGNNIVLLFQSTIFRHIW